MATLRRLSCGFIPKRYSSTNMLISAAFSVFILALLRWNYIYLWFWWSISICIVMQPLPLPLVPRASPSIKEVHGWLWKGSWQVMESTQLLRPNKKKKNAFNGWLARRTSELKLQAIWRLCKVNACVSVTSFPVCTKTHKNLAGLSGIYCWLRRSAGRAAVIFQPRRSEVQKLFHVDF